MAKLNHAGEFTISEFKLMSSSGNVLDLSLAYVTLSLFEDIFSSAMSGIVVVTDTNNILMNLPVTGQEYISLKITTPGLEDFPIDYTDTVFSVTKIDSRIAADETLIFQLHFVSPELLRNSRIRVSKSYTSTISNMVYDVLNSSKYINTSKEVFLEPTKGVRKIIAPNSHPYDFIKKLARESQSEKYNSPHYLFYENTLGIHFRSIESLFKQTSIAEYHTGDAGFAFTSRGKIEEEYKRVINYQMSANNDTLANIVGGMLASKIITHDIFQKSYDINRHSYFDDFYDFKRINFDNLNKSMGLKFSKDNPIYNEVELDEFGNTMGDFDDSKIHLHPTAKTIAGGDATKNDDNINDYIFSANSYKPNAISQTLLKRQAKFMELNAGTSINIEVNGSTTTSCGDCVDFDFPIVGSDHGTDGSDKYYSGKYLISQLRHIFSPETEKHRIAMTLVKDSFSNALPMNASGSQPKGTKGMLHTLTLE